MKRYFGTITLLAFSNFLFCQVPETNPKDSIDYKDIIIKYKDGKKTILNKKDFQQNNPDSLFSVFRNDFVTKYKIQQDSVYICNNIIGKWKFVTAIRTNNKKVNYTEPDYYSFNSDQSFISISSKDTVEGKWSYSNLKEKIRIEYKKPRPYKVSEEAKKHLNSEIIKLLENRTDDELTLNDLNTQKLIFLDFIPTETDDDFLRVIKMIYEKIQ